METKDNNENAENIHLNGLNETGTINGEDVDIIDIGPEELVNIKKVVKYKEINGYMKGEILGKGIFAKVRECIHKRSLKRYAVKIMKKIAIQKMGANTQKNIEREIQLVHKLNHKNVMKMIDFFSTDKKIYIFMEYCAGVVSEMLESAPEQRLPKWQSHHYFCQLIDGLNYLHSLGIYHRDIKDQNLLIDNSHVIKIADFGVSYVSSDLMAKNDLIDGFEGTKLYQPPELLITDDKDESILISGSKFDIWSAGVLLFKMISGVYPFFNNSEDIWDIKSYDHIQYPDIILKDSQLLLLLQNIFVIDFNKRTTIRGIKNHPWIRLKHKTDNDIKIDLPQKTFGDIYRGINLLERLRVRYEYESIEDNKPIFVNQYDYEESIKPKDPNTRSNRTQIRRRQRQRRLSPMNRLVRLGLWSASDD